VVMWQRMFSMAVMRTVWRRNSRLHIVRITGVLNSKYSNIGFVLCLL